MRWPVLRGSGFVLVDESPGLPYVPDSAEPVSPGNTALNYSTTTLCPAIKHTTHSLLRVLPMEAVIVSLPPQRWHCGR